jgi:hypothetical protein
MLNDMDGAQHVEGAITKGVREAVEVTDNVGVGITIQVDSNCSGIFVNSTPDIKNARGSLAYA